MAAAVTLRIWRTAAEPGLGKSIQVGRKPPQLRKKATRAKLPNRTANVHAVHATHER